MHIMKYKSPSQIEFSVSHAMVHTIKDTKRGHTFLYKGAVSMRSEVSGFQSLKDFDNCSEIQKSFKDSFWVTNLQTGRTFVADKDEPISFIKIRMSIDGSDFEDS